MGNTRRYAVSQLGADEATPHRGGPILRSVVVGTGLIAIGLGCHGANVSRPAWTDGPTHREGFVSIPAGRLHCLDRGGTGPTLFLIHGLGDSPHIFDDLVPALRSQVRVEAYARRGFRPSNGDPGVGREADEAIPDGIKRAGSPGDLPHLDPDST